MRKWLSISALLLLAVLTGCGEHARVSARLDALDTLLSLPPTIAEPSAFRKYSNKFVFRQFCRDSANKNIFFALAAPKFGISLTYPYL
ncbi:MAG: hypothetical protein K5778_07280 [Bacteroidaceae bacterium]|nr:hypothetical protein [Bacteroidaceae bacterium]